MTAPPALTAAQLAELTGHVRLINENAQSDEPVQIEASLYTGDVVEGVHELIRLSPALLHYAELGLRAEQAWTPCFVQQPTVCRRYLVQDEEDNPYIAYWIPTKEWKCLGKIVHPVAWRQLPEKYQPVATLTPITP